MAEAETNTPKNNEEQCNSTSVETKTNNSDTIRIRRPRKRKKPLLEDDNGLDSEESEIDISLEKKLRECARRNNLTPLEVKKLLRKIVGNDHVLALVKLQEEEEITKERSLIASSVSDDPLNLEETEEKDKIDNPPKLTRAKAKALNQQPVCLPSLNEIEPEPEVTALITEEMNTDDEDEDEEYEPKEEDYVYSEDDFNTTVSDLDSQPRTPLTNVIYCSEVESPVLSQPSTSKYSNDGVFKIPRERTVSGLTKEDEIIAKRTRSKLCLETTSIEAIESTFVPPDITTDMYEFDQDVDQEWMEFLNEFTKPLNKITVTEEDDPEEDPEYVAADKIPIDAEELKDVNISKKELSDLVAELFDGLVKEGVFLEDIPEIDASKKLPDKNINQRSATKSPLKKKPKFCVESQPIFTSPTTDERFPANHFAITGEVSNSESHTQVGTDTNNLLQNNLNNSGDYTFIANQNESVFTPNIMSTPSTNAQIIRTTNISTPLELVTTQISDHHFTVSNKSTYAPTQHVTTVVNSISANVRVCPYETNVNYTPTIVSNVVNAEPQSVGMLQQQPIVTELQSPLMQQRTITLITYPAQGGAPCYKVVPLSSLNFVGQNINLATGEPLITTVQSGNQIIDITNENSSCIAQPIHFNSINNTAYRIKSGYITHPDIYEMWNGDAHKSAEKYFKKFYDEKYNEILLTQPVSVMFDETEPFGFTSNQREIFEQQLRMHVQILTQNYLQTYSHPQFWQKAKSQKDMLLDLEKKCGLNDKSAFNSWNLKGALQLVNEWENELAKPNEENQDFMDFIYHQIERGESNKRPRGNRIIRFPPKTMKIILQSNVFLYPELLPRLPFINSNHADYHDLAPIESHLLAFELEKYLPSIKEKIKLQHRKNNAVRLTCDKISHEIMTGKSGRRLFDFYKQELKAYNYNPIKYFNEKRVAPPFQHFLIPVNFNCVLPPIKKKSQLSMLWKEFVTELEAKELGQDDELEDDTNEDVCDRKQRKKERKEQRRERRKDKSRELKKRPSKSQNVVINLNYVLDNPNNYENNAVSTSEMELQRSNSISTNPVTKIERRSSITDYSEVFTKIHEPLDIKFGDDASYLHHLNSQFNQNPLENEALISTNTTITNEISSKDVAQEDDSLENSIKQTSSQRLLTDYFTSLSEKKMSGSESEKNKTHEFSNSSTGVGKIFKKISHRVLRLYKLQNRGLRFSLRRSRYGFRSYKIIKRLKERKRLQNKLKNLFIRYWKYLHQMYNNYKNILLRKCFAHFKKLEIFSDFLEILKMVCEKTQNMKNSKLLNLEQKICSSNDVASSETSTAEENRIQIIMPKGCDVDVDKDTITANNFFDKVEERFYSSGKEIKFKRFLSILKLFNPDDSTTVWLYKKMGKLFLPDYPDLAEIFLHFLLPAEAYEASQFFRNYMIENKETFSENLTKYFEEYQQRNSEIYKCLNDLAQNNKAPTTEKIKRKLSPLLGTNSFLNEWLQQIFVEEKRPENLNVEGAYNAASQETDSKQTSIAFEARDLTTDLSELQPSETKYINARLASVSKVFLPEALASLAKSLINGETIAVVSLDVPQKSKKLNRTSEISHIQNEDLNIFENCYETKFNNIKDLIENVNLEDETEINETIINEIHSSKIEYNIMEDELTQQNNNQEKEISIQEAFLKDNKNFSERNQPQNEIEMIDHTGIQASSEPVVVIDTRKSNELKNVKKSKKTTKAITNEQPLKSDPKSSILNTCRTRSQRNAKKVIPKNNANVKTDSVKDGISIENHNDDGKSEEPTSRKSKRSNTNENIKLPNQSWQRDEDKIILEEARLDFDSHEDLLEQIATKLVRRSFSEIDNRYKFLMNLLSQFQNN